MTELEQDLKSCIEDWHDGNDFGEWCRFCDAYVERDKGKLLPVAHESNCLTVKYAYLLEKL